MAGVGGGALNHPDDGTIGFGYGTGTGANREDLLDLITNIDPWDTPFATSCPKVKANGIVHQWLYETLAPTATGSGAAAVEGADWAMTSATTRPTRDSNICMIFRKDISMAESQRAVNAAGFQDAYQREIVKATREIARNIESNIFQNIGVSSTGSTAATRIMKSLFTWLSATAVCCDVSGSQLTNFSPTTLAAGGLNGALELAYNNGANPEVAYTQPNTKRNISQLVAPQQNRNIAASEKRLINTIDIYDSDFGPVQIVADRWLGAVTNTATTTTDATSTAMLTSNGSIYFMNQSMARLAFLRPVMHTFVGKRGDSVAGMVAGELTLEILNPSAHFVLRGVKKFTG